jgi:DNA-binding transcriptional LysR family regulator
MNLEDLRTFVEVADAGGVAPGARRLGVSKSIVSRHLARLEESVGAQLLSRTTRGSTLTEAGTSFREHASRVLAELDAAQEALTGSGELRGLLRIAAPLSFGVTQLAPVIAELARRHPLLRIDTSYSDRFVDLVAEGFDAAVRLGLLSDSSLVARRISSFRGKLVASPTYIAQHGQPRTWSELADHEAVTQRGEVWPVPGRGAKPGTLRPQGRFTADNGEAVLAAALAGIGIAALPDFLVDPHIEAGRLTLLLGDQAFPELGMFVVRPPGTVASRKVRVLIDVLVEYFDQRESA